MPPQKRSRAAAKRDDDAEMADAPSPATRRAAGSDDSSDDDSDDDDDDALTFTAQAAGGDDDDDDSDEDDDEMDGSGSGAGSGDAARLVNVEFVFSDPREEHFHSVKQYLLAYLPSSQPFHVSGLASLVVGQVAAGTMVCAEGESDVYGFITALGLDRYKDDASLAQVVQYIAKRVPARDQARFQQLLATKRVALVLNERMVNMPYQLVPPLHAALHEDIEWAAANEVSPEVRQSFQFDYFLILSSCAVEKASAAAPAGKKKAKTATTPAAAAGAKFYANFEDEFLEPEAEIAFSFETPRGDREREHERPDQSQKHSVVMLIERARHKAALAGIAAMINA